MPNLSRTGLDLDKAQRLRLGSGPAYIWHRAGGRGQGPREFCVPEAASLADVVEASDQFEIVTRADAQDDIDAENDTSDEEDDIDLD